MNEQRHIEVGLQLPLKLKNEVEGETTIICNKSFLDPENFKSINEP
jgi:hypothetical protein